MSKLAGRPSTIVTPRLGTCGRRPEFLLERLPLPLNEDDVAVLLRVRTIEAEREPGAERQTTEAGVTIPGAGLTRPRGV